MCLGPYWWGHVSTLGVTVSQLERLADKSRRGNWLGLELRAA